MAQHYPQHEGWFRPAMRAFKQSCCDCNLVHKIDFRLRNGKLEMRRDRDNVATMNKRRTTPVVARYTIAKQLRAIGKKR